MDDSINLSDQANLMTWKEGNFALVKANEKIFKIPIGIWKKYAKTGFVFSVENELYHKDLLSKKITKIEL